MVTCYGAADKTLYLTPSKLLLDTDLNYPNLGALLNKKRWRLNTEKRQMQSALGMVIYLYTNLTLLRCLTTSVWEFSSKYQKKIIIKKYNFIILDRI